MNEVVKLSPRAEAMMPHYNNAKKALALVVRVDEVKKQRDEAMAVQLYARQAQDTALFDMATEIRMRAERRAGEILIAMQESGERRTGGGNIKGVPVKEIVGPVQAKRRQLLPSQDGTVKVVPATLAELGLTRKQAGAFQDLARKPEDEFEQEIVEAKKPRKASPARMPTVNADADHPGLERLQKAWFMASPEECDLFQKWVIKHASRKT